jgi:putative membrane protein
MITQNSTTLFLLIRKNWQKFALLAMISVAVEWLSPHIDVNKKLFTPGSLGFLITALSIFLAFRLGQAYDRWWEARKLWGGIVNLSRTFARQATTFISNKTASLPMSDEEIATVQKELVYRQIAFVNALRLTLREQQMWEEIRPFLPAAEFAALLDKRNKPSEIIQHQADALVTLYGRGVLNDFRYIQLDRSLKELVDCQGGCDRIKHTAFPDRVVYITQMSAWMAAVLIPLTVSDFGPGSGFLDGPIYSIFETIVLLLMMSLFLMVGRIGNQLKDPFENRSNDTPMTAICRTVEIDLREILGETDLPPKLQPVNGVLM